MLNGYSSLLIAGLSLLSLTAPSSTLSADWLRLCWQKQAAPLRDNQLALNYRETVSELEHSATPWQATAYTGRGTVWCSAENFAKQDTLLEAGKSQPFFSSTQRNAATLLFKDYGEDTLARVTPKMQRECVFRAARYSPIALLAYFIRFHVQPDPASAPDVARYRTTIDQTEVTLSIRKKDALLSQVNLLSDDELLGDVATVIKYQDYKSLVGLQYPTTIQVTKVNGKLQDEVKIYAAASRLAAPVLLSPPAGYQLKDPEETAPTVNVVHYRPHLSFLEMKHTDARALVVEFDTFLLVAEAPLNSANGELLAQEAQKIAPGKPIRYFAAGHYHPHYVGGMRPFVRRGATVLCGAGSGAYVRYLAEARHTLQPDSLQLRPRPVQVEEITTHKTIAEGTLEMQIFCVGRQSAHTNDYLLYYFPGEKLLFEDDLVWLSKNGPAKKASPRQAALYQAIKSLAIPVDTIVQSWPLTGFGVKTVIPFPELEQSAQ